MLDALPKCAGHNLALDLVRVEISNDKTVTDVYRCPSPGCKTEVNCQQAPRAVESGKS
jgi:hypothetical protein